MNQLAIIRKHLNCIDKAWEGIVTPKTRKRAGGLIRERCMRWDGFEMPSMGDSVTVGSAGEVLRVEGAFGGEVAVKAKESGFPGVSTTTVGGVTTVYPLSWEEGERGPGAFEHEIEGDVDGSTGETEVVSSLPEPVEMVGGWPAVAEIVACGLAPNRRHNRGRLPDGRVVSIERGLGLVWRDGAKYRCRLVRAGGASLYRATV